MEDSGDLARSENEWVDVRPEAMVYSENNRPLSAREAVLSTLPRHLIYLAWTPPSGKTSPSSPTCTDE